MRDNSKILDLYPMIHKDKLVYCYKENIIRIGTDDNDVVEVLDKNYLYYSTLLMMDGNTKVRNILKANSWLTLSNLSSIIIKLVKANVLSVLNRSFDELSKNKRYRSDLTYYFSEGLNGEIILDKLSRMKVTILGVGGGGSLIALQLANLGIKNIHLVDHDVIDISNLNRQFIFNKRDLGKYKVDVIKQFLSSRHKGIKITTSILKLDKVKETMNEIDNSDWVFCCMDEPPYIAQRIVNRACYLKNIPSVYGFSSRDAGKLLIVNPQVTGCVDCLLTSEDSLEFRELIKSLKKSNFSPVTPIIVPNMMLEVSWMVKKWLLQITDDKSMGNVLYRFDYNTFKDEKFVEFSKQRYCPTCGKGDNSELWKIIPLN